MSTTTEQANGTATHETKRARILALREQLIAFAFAGGPIILHTRFRTGDPGCAVGRVAAVTRENVTIIINRTSEVVIPLTAVESVTAMQPHARDEHR